MPGALTLATGTDVLAPLKLTSGTNLTTATVGSIEYDGKAIYATPQDSERGVIPAEQWYVLAAPRVTTPGVTTQQSLFGVGVHVSSSTRYAYNIEMQVTRSAGGNNHALSVAFAGTAGPTRITYIATTYEPTSPAFFMTDQSITTGFTTGVAITLATADPGLHVVKLSGMVDISTGGTLIPTVGFGVDPGTLTIGAHSFMRLSPIGGTSTNTIVGSWV